MGYLYGTPPFYAQRALKKAEEEAKKEVLWIYIVFHFMTLWGSGVFWWVYLYDFICLYCFFFGSFLSLFLCPIPVYSFCFIFLFYYYPLETLWFLLRDRKGGYPDGMGSGEELCRVEGREIITRIYYVRLNPNFNKRKKVTPPKMA